MKNKLTQQDIESVIEEIQFIRLGSKTTVCFLLLKNGFEVTGNSACVSPENFDEEIGRSVAKADAINKIWLLEGYLFQEKLNYIENPCSNKII